ncbi:MAG: hypothetical protein AAF198_04335 [Pseudomonadota bacterium]
MSGSQEKRLNRYSQKLPEELSSLAREALRRVIRPPTDFSNVSERLLKASIDSSSALDSLLVELRGLGLEESELVVTHIPEALDQLGHDWHQDRRSWIEVSIASARLQAVVSASFLPMKTAPAAPGTVLILVPRGEDHTIGPAILQKRLLEMGYFADLLVDATESAIQDNCDLHSVDIVLVSAYRPESLQLAVDLAAFSKSHDPALPCVLGGGITAFDIIKPQEFDLLTNDLDKALAFASTDKIKSLKNDMGAVYDT